MKSLSRLNYIVSFSFPIRNFLQVYENEEFLNITQDKLIEIVSDDNLRVNKEESVFLAVEKWASHNLDARKEKFETVLQNVRLPLLSPYFLHDCVEDSVVVKESEECRKLVEEAKLWHLLPGRKSELKNLRCKPRNNALLAEVS